MEYRRVWAEINLGNLAHNIVSIRKHVPAGTALMGIVKADAYGHGAVEVAGTMANNGADFLGVAISEEGVQLRQAGITAPVLVMGFTPPHILSEVVRHDLIQTVFSIEGAAALSKTAARMGKRAIVHIEVDTGMSRLGFMPNPEGIQAICDIARDPNLLVQGIFTHFATSDQLDYSFMHEQEARYNHVLGELTRRGLHIPYRHMSNSGAVIQTVRGNMPSVFMDITRVGILLYGLPASAELTQAYVPLGLKPVMRLMTQVSMVKHLEAGVGISYSHIYKTNRETTIAVLPVGYADGYPRRLSHGGRVLVHGQHAPIAGAICMDQCMADITGIPNVAPGDPVALLGSKEEGLCADDLAEIVGTISYEIVCGIGKRVPRVYHGP